MLQYEKPMNMVAVHLTFQVLSVPYENRVAKPTAPELQVKKKKTPQHSHLQDGSNQDLQVCAGTLHIVTGPGTKWRFSDLSLHDTTVFWAMTE